MKKSTPPLRSPGLSPKLRLVQLFGPSLGLIQLQSDASGYILTYKPIYQDFSLKKMYGLDFRKWDVISLGKYMTPSQQVY